MGCPRAARGRRVLQARGPPMGGPQAAHQLNGFGSGHDLVVLDPARPARESRGCVRAGLRAARARPIATLSWQ
jgi:hypothetical protein